MTDVFYQAVYSFSIMFAATFAFLGPLATIGACSAIQAGGRVRDEILISICVGFGVPIFMATVIAFIVTMKAVSVSIYVTLFLILFLITLTARLIRKY